MDKEDKPKSQALAVPSRVGGRGSVQPTCHRGLAGLLRKRAARRVWYRYHCWHHSQRSTPTSALMGAGSMPLGLCIPSISGTIPMATLGSRAIVPAFVAGVGVGRERFALPVNHCLPLLESFLAVDVPQCFPEPRKSALGGAHSHQAVHCLSLTVFVPSRLLTNQPHQSLLPRNQGRSAPQATSTSRQRR